MADPAPTPEVPSPSPTTEVEVMRKELEAISTAMSALVELPVESRKRVIWYIADTFGFSQQPQLPRQTTPVQPAGPRTRSVPIPPGTNPQALQQAVGAAGLPSSR